MMKIEQMFTLFSITSCLIFAYGSDLKVKKKTVDVFDVKAVSNQLQSFVAELTSDPGPFSLERTIYERSYSISSGVSENITFEFSFEVKQSNQDEPLAFMRDTLVIVCFTSGKVRSATIRTETFGESDLRESSWLETRSRLILHWSKSGALSIGPIYVPDSRWIIDDAIKLCDKDRSIPKGELEFYYMRISSLGKYSDGVPVMTVVVRFWWNNSKKLPAFVRKEGLRQDVSVLFDLARKKVGNVRIKTGLVSEEGYR